MKKSVFVVLTALMIVCAVPVMAERVAAKRVAADAMIAPMANCPLVAGDAYVNVNFNTTETDIAKVKTVVDSKTAEAEALAKEAGLTEIELQSSNYSINVNSNSGNCTDATRTFQVYGGFNYKVKPADKAPDFVVKLAEKGYNSSLSTSSSRQCQ